MAAKKTACQQRAAHRAAQNKYVAKAPAKQAQAVKKSAAKPSTKAGKPSSSSGKGTQGSKIGRPRKPC